MNETSSLNYKLIKCYWDKAQPTILGPYMMDGYGFPMSAGQFRLRN